ncbi:DUF1929 domain-containing protein [Maribacter sp. MJ134]|uniref:galactose oxidase-like domain-containing protein n=1 Tax=Maribacter sp. MJ134 TaxID=2496865 RepID=UPI000F84D45E|nr:galactose oxidase-like domain-containing protein [Maribacter sp. MJ134]AZQ58464.1 DUF1929 domain-containing protein [Maribacter sp. MJ134]
MMKNNFFSYYIILLMFFSGIILKAQNQATQGEWSPIINMGIVPVAAANLPDGTLITWSSKFPDTYTEVGDGMTYTAIFDPALGPHGQALPFTQTTTNHDMFCPGINNLPDGRILAAGGTSSERTTIYDPETQIWSRAADMNIPRGYQGNVTLSDGSVFTVGGSWSDMNLPSTNGGKNAELYTPETGWISLPGIQGDNLYNSNDASQESQGIYRLDNHVWLWESSNRELFKIGPGEIMQRIDVTGNGSMTDVGQRGNDTYSIKGTTVMFDIDKVFKVGGSESYASNTPAKDNSYIIDISTSVPSVIQTPNMANERTMHNSTVLPNGQILITGGLDQAVVFSDVGAELGAELFDPSTNSWSQMAGMASPRTYHSVSILLTDGRVFVGGGGLCDPTPGCVNHPDAEIFSPPYLFNPNGTLATRPTISAPETSDYLTDISVIGSPGISEFSLVRFSAVTHSTNNEQRRIPVSFTSIGNDYTVSIPDRNLLPPGYYMLFAMDANGVPSMAETIRIGDAIPLQSNPNLVMHLEFEETSGSVAFDSSGNSNDGAVIFVDNNTATKIPSTDNWTTDGLFGNAIEFDGREFQSNTIIDIPYDSTFSEIEESVTVMAWVNRDDIDYNVSILSHDYPSLFFGFHNNLYKWAFQTSNGVMDCYSGYTPIGQWVHIAATYDGNIARLFANGNEICTRNISGTINLEPNTPNFSSFTASGFYEHRPVGNQILIDNNYNESGVTDEIDGRIDELKVYNTALGPQEIKAFYDLGVGLQGVQNCPTGTITAEYRIGNGSWNTGNNINVPEGSEVYIRAIANGEYFATTTEIDGNTFSSVSDFNQTNGYRISTGTKNGDNDGFVSSDDNGQYVLTTATGCMTVVNLNVVGNCDANDTPVTAEWSFDGGNTWNSGTEGDNIAITTIVGQDVRLSLLPNNIDGDPNNPLLLFDVVLPNGSIVNDLTNLELNNIQTNESGIYILESSEGCAITIDLTIETVVCDATTIKAEWSFDNVNYSEAPDELPVTVEATTGDDFYISMVPNGVEFTVSYQGTDLYTGQQDYFLENVDTADSGDYVITSVQGCSTTLTLNVTDVVCDATTIKAEWSFDNVNYSEAPDELPVTVEATTGDDFYISMVPNGVEFTVSYQGTDLYTGQQDYFLENVDTADSGDYVITSVQGCSTTLTLNVTDVVCDATTIKAEWSFDNVNYSEAPDELPVTVEATTGDDFYISMVPNGVEFTVSYQGTDLYTGQQDYFLENVDTADSGDYVITSVQGCSTTLTLNVTDVVCDATTIKAEWSFDNVNYSEAPDELPVTVEATTGDDFYISMVPNGVEFTVSYQGTDLYTGQQDYFLENVDTADSGDYVITSVQGCSTTLTLNVTDVVCDATTIKAEWSFDNVNYSEAPDELPVTVEATTGDDFYISMVPNGVEFTVSYQGTDLYTGQQDYFLENVDTADSGDYVITSVQGCSTTLTLNVTDVVCDATTIKAEWSFDNVNYSEAPDELPVTVEATTGDDFYISMVPNGVEFTVSYQGTDLYTGQQDYFLENVDTADSGDYVITSVQGCSTTLTLNVTDVVCDATTIKAEWSFDNVNYSEAPDELPVTVEATTGDDFYISMVPNGVEFTVSYQGTDLYTGQQDYFLENVDTADSGDYVITSVQGCSTTLTLNVTDVVCDATTIKAEWSFDNVNYSEAPDELPVTVEATTGDDFYISMVPNGVEFTVSYQGTDLYTGQQDYFLENVDTADSGDYVITSVQGCSTTLTLNVNCLSGPFTPEYILNGVASNGENAITINEGVSLLLSTVEDNVSFTITDPFGTINNGDLDLGNTVINQSGQYTFISIEGCSAILEVNIVDPCPLGSFTAQYTVGGNQGSGQESISVEEGTSVVLDIVQQDVAYTIQAPDGAVTNGVLDLGAITLEQQGLYTYLSENGCETTLSITVTEIIDPCPQGSFTAQYTVGGNQGSGQESISVEEGTSVVLDIVQQDIAYTIQAPDGAVINGVLDLGAITLEQQGLYTYLSENGCETTLSITVTEIIDPCPQGSFTAQYTVGGNQGSGQESISVEEGTSVVLDIVQQDIAYTIQAPDGAVINGVLDLGAITLEQQGLYTYLSENGCETTLSITVTEIIDPCPQGSFTAQYTVGGNQGSGQESISVEEGTSVVLDIVQQDIAYTIQAPDGAVINGVLDLGAITLEQQGLYTYLSENGCETTLSITVTISNEPLSCAVFTPTYTIDGVQESGNSSITINEGATLQLGISDENFQYTITQPNESITIGVLNISNITMEQAGTYIFNSENGCVQQIIVNVEPMEEQTSIDAVIIYPNPIYDGNVRFILNDFMDEMVMIRFYDIYGKMVISNIFQKNHAQEVTVEVGSLSVGTYIVEITRGENNDSTVKKILKLR